MTDRFVLPDLDHLAPAIPAADALALAAGEAAGRSGSLPAAAMALLGGGEPDDDSLLAAAAGVVTSVRGQVRECFSPLYLTNHCDAGCRMCGLQAGNTRVLRVFAGRRTILDQLEILRDVEGVRAVALVTGEYAGAFSRQAAAFHVGWAARQALDMGMAHVTLNMGSLGPAEIAVLADWVAPGEPVALSVFQETYQPEVYRRFMGETGPKADFAYRLGALDRWLDAGYRQVNPGLLVGLADPLAEVASFVAHAEHLRRRGGDVRLSLPRMRPAHGGGGALRVDDRLYRRIVAVLALLLPDCPIVLTTREAPAMQAELLPMVGLFSPGSPDVAPYRRDEPLLNRPDSSQFQIADGRRPAEVLAGVARLGYRLRHWQPTGEDR